MLPWDSKGHERPGSEYRCIPSLKWFFYSDRVPDFSSTRGDGFISPHQLVEQATRGLHRLVEELAALHSDFDRAVRAWTSDLASTRELLIHFEAGLLWSDDETARETAEKLAPTMASFRSVYDKILAAGRQGWFGYISI